jgi:hypothetical protein
MKILCKKNGCILRSDDEAFLGLANGEYTVEIKKERNPKFNNKYRVLLNLLFEHQDFYDTKDAFEIEMKFLVGHFKTHITMKGNPVYIPLSTSFDSIDEIEFEKIYNRTLDVAFSKFIKGTEEDKNNFTRELCKFI